MTILLMAAFLGATAASAQSDETKFAEGRTAFDKYKDCPTALRAFDAISPEGRRDPVWISYMARTQKCLGNIPEAVRYYEQYDQLVPGQVDVINTIGDLRYQLVKQEEANKRAEERRIEQAKRAEEEKAAAAQRIPEETRQLPNTLQSLRGLFQNLKPAERDGDGEYRTYSVRILSASGCMIVLQNNESRGHWDPEENRYVRYENTTEVTIKLDQLNVRASSGSYSAYPLNLQIRDDDGYHAPKGSLNAKLTYYKSISGPMKGKPTFYPPSEGVVSEILFDSEKIRDQALGYFERAIEPCKAMARR
jgi:tetratricopeptide (TPR) repeat protein